MTDLHKITIHTAEVKPALPKIISLSPGPYHIQVSWDGLDDIPSDASVQVQYLRESSKAMAFTPLVKVSDKSFLIDGIAAGEKVECRLRVVTASGYHSGWSVFISQSASEDATDYLNEISGSSAIFSSNQLAPIQGEAVALTSISIEEQTLSAVLISLLPVNDEVVAVNKAKTVAKAVKAAFDELRTDFNVAEDSGAYVFLDAKQLNEHVSRYGAPGCYKTTISTS